MIDMTGDVGFEAFQPPKEKAPWGPQPRPKVEGSPLDGAGRLKGRTGMRQHDVAECRSKPTAPVAEYAPVKECICKVLDD
jgi:hypothetical protein